jgi:hypothetical protein
MADFGVAVRLTAGRSCRVESRSLRTLRGSRSTAANSPPSPCQATVSMTATYGSTIRHSATIIFVLVNMFMFLLCYQ